MNLNSFVIKVVLIYFGVFLFRRYIERRLEQALKQDKGSGCEIPKLDPFAKEVTQFDKEMPKVVCQGRDWVKCYVSFGVFIVISKKKNRSFRYYMFIYNEIGWF